MCTEYMRTYQEAAQDVPKPKRAGRKNDLFPTSKIKKPEFSMNSRQVEHRYQTQRVPTPPRDWSLDNLKTRNNLPIEERASTERLS